VNVAESATATFKLLPAAPGKRAANSPTAASPFAYDAIQQKKNLQKEKLLLLVLEQKLKMEKFYQWKLKLETLFYLENGQELKLKLTAWSIAS
jgi:hypothetical protein